MANQETANSKKCKARLQMKKVQGEAADPRRLNGSYEYPAIKRFLKTCFRAPLGLWWPLAEPKWLWTSSTFRVFIYIPQKLALVICKGMYKPVHRISRSMWWQCTPCLTSGHPPRVCLSSCPQLSRWSPHKSESPRPLLYLATENCGLYKGPCWGVRGQSGKCSQSTCM